MARAKPPKKLLDSAEGEYEIRSDQKRCPKCSSIVSRELLRCPFCSHAPWRWHPNSRLFIFTLLICLFLFILFPLLTSRDRSYRVPVKEDAKP